MFTCNHITILCSEIERSFDFYSNKLGLELLHRWPRMFAVRAGEVRFSVSQSDEIAKDGNVQIILRTDNSDEAKAELVGKGITLAQDIVEAPGFMRFFTIEDPNGNIIHVA